MEKPRNEPPASVRWGLIAFAAVASAQVVLCIIHAPWRDEIQALLIARLPLGRLFDLLHYEGHPALWYLILAAASQFIASPAVLPAVQVLVALGIQSIVWRRSPFAWPTKLLISLGYFILFEYGVIARNYGLGVLLFLAFIALRRSWVAWPLLALMCHAAVHTAVLAGVGALILLLVEKRWSWSGAILLAISGLLALATVVPAHDSFPGPAAGRAFSAHLLFAVRGLATATAPVRIGAYPVEWPWFGPPAWYIVAGLLTPIVGAAALIRSPRLCGLYLLFCASMLAIGILIYPIQARHAGLISILLIGLLWIEQDASGVPPNISARILLTWLAVSGIWMAACSIVQPFSQSRALANWVREQKLANARWAAFPGIIGTEFSGQFERPSFSVERGCWTTYQRWNYNYDLRPQGSALRRRLEDFANSVGPSYLMTEEPLPMGPELNAKQLTTFREAMSSQALFIYRLEPSRLALRPLATCR